MVPALLASSMVGCGGDEELLLDVTSTFAEETLVFDHPAGLVETIAGADLARFCFEEELSARYPRCIDFAVVGEAPGGDFNETLELGEEVDYRYTSFTTPGGGASGSPIHEIDGYVELGGRVVSIAASAADDSGFTDALWALPIITTLRSASG